MAPSDEAKNHKNAHGKKIARPTHLVQFAEAEKRSQDTGMRNSYALQLPVTPLPESLDTGFSTTPWPESLDIQPATSLPEALPASIEHLPTQPQLQAVVTSSPFALMIDGLLISEQPTMITPVVGDVNK